MSLGRELSDEFKSRYAAYHPYGEVELFRTLIESFYALRSYDITEIHGKRTIVQYKEDQGWFTQPARCELADIFFLVYSLKKKEARYFVMQNKIQPKRNCTQIHANLIQYELLATKKFFEYVKTHTTSHLLDSAINDSVCVYGNFYNTAPGVMNEMSVFTASKLTFKGRTPSAVTRRYPVREIEYLGVIDDVASMRILPKDFEGTDDLKKFGDLTEEMYIGEPLNGVVLNDINEMLLTLPDERYVNNMGKTVEELREEMRRLGASLDIPAGQTDEAGKSGELIHRCKKIIIINVDKNEPNN